MVFVMLPYRDTVRRGAVIIAARVLGFRLTNYKTCCVYKLKLVAPSFQILIEVCLRASVHALLLMHVWFDVLFFYSVFDLKPSETWHTITIFICRGIYGAFFWVLVADSYSIFFFKTGPKRRQTTEDIRG